LEAIQQQQLRLPVLLQVVLPLVLLHSMPVVLVVVVMLLSTLLFFLVSAPRGAGAGTAAMEAR
jgi:hypothetical protein